MMTKTPRGARAPGPSPVDPGDEPITPAPSPAEAEGRAEGRAESRAESRAEAEAEAGTRAGAWGLEQVARPLLQVIQRITGVETTFITEIDWSAQRQDVVMALNTQGPIVGEGTSVDWSDSMCRWTFLSAKESSSDVAGDFPGSIGGDKLGMRTFFALPIQAGGSTIGTVCGASRHTVEIDAQALDLVRLVGEALSTQIQADAEIRRQRSRSEALQALAMTDDLTGLPNRRAFMGRWEEELSRAARHRLPIALVLVDVDSFKEVNDTYGHLVGDDVLGALGEAVRSVARSEDFSARLGGDELALVAPHAARDGAIAIGDRLRRAFAERTALLGIPCTISVGVACSDDVPYRDLMARADEALYRSKGRGKDRTSVAPVDRASVAPADPTSVAPVDPTGVAPVDGASVAPVDPTGVAPVDGASVASADPTSVAPVDGASDARGGHRSR